MNCRPYVKTFLFLVVVALTALALAAAAGRPATVSATGWTWDDGALTHSS